MTARTLTQADLVAEATALFGADPYQWAFQCPSCDDVATGQHFKDALAEHPRTHKDGSPVTASDILGQECIGRTLGVLRRDTPYSGRGCDWCAYGLFHGPWRVTLPEDKTMYCFPLAETAPTDEAR